MPYHQARYRDDGNAGPPTLAGRTAMLVVRCGRALLLDTPAERLRFTSWLYRAVWRLAVREEVVRPEFRGCRLAIPAMDVTIVPGLFGGYYERVELTLFERLAQISGTVLDVGGNIGIYACLGGVRLPEGGTLVTFEPEPGNLRYLRSNLADHDLLDRVRVEPCAVGAADGEVTLYLAASSVGRHSASPRNAGPDHREIRVPVVSLDGYLSRSGGGPVDLVKVDVEGYDGYVLRGARDLLHRDKPTLMIEFAPTHLRNCGFAPQELVDRVCAAYPHVFLVDERRGCVRRAARDALARLARGRDRHNIVAAARPEHLRLIQAGDVAVLAR